MLRRLPIESSGPLVIFAFSRLAIVVVGIVTMLVLSVPDDGRAIAVVASIALPWSALVIALTLRDPHYALSPLIAAGDLAALLAIELMAPETYGGLRFAALFLVAAHAQIHGEARGITAALISAGVLVTATAVRGDAPLEGDVLAFYEAAFTTCALATGLVVGRLRTAESAGRLRARRLTRRTIQAEDEVRRRVAEAIHDGPVQELIGLGMILSSAGKAAREGRREEAAELIDEARAVAERNLRVLRDEIVDFGPHAFQELAFETAVENCLPTWKRRYGLDVSLDIERVSLPAETAGALFRIAQEAVANAGRHADADMITISLRAVNSAVELRVADDGHGFDHGALAAPKPGHLGLASMRERAELLDGQLDIETSSSGTRVLVRAPLPSAGVSG
jgi:two-component system NarL family sensor kinase